jgi:hypothetical protein
MKLYGLWFTSKNKIDYAQCSIWSNSIKDLKESESYLEFKQLAKKAGGKITITFISKYECRPCYHGAEINKFWKKIEHFPKQNLEIHESMEKILAIYQLAIDENRITENED